MPIAIEFPLKEDIGALQCKEMVFISGTIYTARDQAHKRLVESLQRGGNLPIPLKGQLLYYCGPTPPKKNGLFGSAGPTTSSRMDPFTPILMEAGLSACLGKGPRNQTVREACMKYKAVYLITFGGAGAALAKCILSQHLVAYEDLGTEAIYKLEVKDLPAIVAIDSHGQVLEEGSWLSRMKEYEV